MYFMRLNERFTHFSLAYWVLLPLFVECLTALPAAKQKCLAIELDPA